jgi:hypothetical protein
MLLSQYLGGVSLAFAAQASFLRPTSPEQVALVSDELSVPGENPLTFCNPPDNYILNIDSVDLTPNPPEA